MALQVGEQAPDFDVPGVVGNIKVRVKLSDYRDKNLVLAFYALDWTPTWTAQMPGYNARLERFAGYDAQVVGSSVDSIYSHIAWQKKEIGMLNFPLASDFYPHGGMAKKFGIFREGDPIPGINDRAIFIIGKDRKIAFSKTYPLDRVPDDEEIFETLKSL
jgi:peroxiredoxin